MIKKLIVTFVMSFVILTVVVAVYSVRTGERQRPSIPGDADNQPAGLRHVPTEAPLTAIHE